MDTNLTDLFEKFNSEDRCREYLELLRWPSGICCVRCGDLSVSKLASRHQYECNGCRYQFSATAGTVFHDSHLPLWKWFLATYLICEAKKGVSANQIKRTLGISYKTAWYLCHRIREAMKSDNSASSLALSKPMKPLLAVLMTSGESADETKSLAWLESFNAADQCEPRRFHHAALVLSLLS